MDAPGWLSRRLADVAFDDDWLGEREREVLAGLRFKARRADWRLGRWTSKSCLSAWLDVAPARIEVLAAPDGAPEAWVDGERCPVSVSLSHRDGRALAVVGAPPLVAGCDLEVVQPRSDSFIRQWLTATEQALISELPTHGRPLLANLIWAAKEAAAKVRRQGLALDFRRASVTVDPTAQGSEWHPLQIAWSDVSGTTAGWWRSEPSWVMVIAAQPAPAWPVEIGTPAAGG